MSKWTPEDAEFKKQIAKQFKAARDRAVESGYSVEDFVGSLGITRAALCKYVNQKAIPGLRVLQRARYWGVEVSYGELGNRYVWTKRKTPGQLELQFSLDDIKKEQIKIKKFSPKTDGSVELHINIDFSKRA